MYRYRCDQCATTSPAVRSRVEVEHERDRHRRVLHGGHIPDGERMQRTARSVLGDRTAMVAIAVLAVILLLSLVVGRIH
jgi:hypothetical protein